MWSATMSSPVGTVYREIFTQVKNSDFEGQYKHLYEIHAAPNWLWAALLLAKNSTKARKAVAPLREILAGYNLDSHLNVLMTHLDRFDFRGAENSLATLITCINTKIFVN